MSRISRLSLNKHTFSSSESIRHSLEQLRSEMEKNIRGTLEQVGSEMKEMKERLATLTAAAEEKRDEGQSQEKHTKTSKKSNII